MQNAIVATDASCASKHHLLVERLSPSGGARPTAAELPILEVPPGVSYLEPALEPLALKTRRPRGRALVLEPVQVDGRAGGRARLLLLTPPELRVRRNGRPVPVVELLRVGDQLQLDARAVLHVTEYRRGGATEPTRELVGRPCGVCRLPLTPDTRVYVCGCGLPLHLEGPPRPAEERLECALLGDCPSCGAAVRTHGGPTWLPEL